MAYENYTQVAWTAGTPMTAERFQQMTENIQQVKDATDDNPRGIIKLKEITTDITFSDMDAAHEIINLKNEGSGNPDNSVTLPGGRMARVSLTFPGLKISDPGQEDSTYILRLSQGNPANTATTLYQWRISQPIHTYLNAQTTNPPTTSNTTVRTSAYYFGAGTYSYVLSIPAGAGITGSNGSGVFNIEITRDSGASALNPTTVTIPCGETSRMQLYIEDIGGIAEA